MNIKKFFINFAIVTIMTFLMATSANASDGGYCVNIAVADITPSSIGVDEEFTVEIQVENCGDKIPKDSSIEIVNSYSEIIIKENPIINIGRLEYGNSKRSIVYHMKTTKNIIPGDYVIKTLVFAGDDFFSVKSEAEITISIIADESELSIASIKTSPVLPYKGDTIEMTLRIENTGDGTAKSVEVYMDHPFKGIKQSFIGALDSNEDGPAVLTFIADEAGEFKFPVTISYKDDFGENEIKTNINLSVLKKKSNIGLILIAILILSAFGAGIYYFIKTKKSKNKIIHQLLGGETKDKTEFEEPSERKEIKMHRRTTQTHKEKQERERKERRKKEFKREVLKKYKK